MARTPATTDYGAPPARSNKMHRPLLLANHILHFISSIIVMSIAAYFIRHFSRNTHLLYWVALVSTLPTSHVAMQAVVDQPQAAIDALLYLPALVLPALKSYKGYLAPLAWILSYLWLTAFIFAAQDYRHGNCVWRSPAFVNKCRLKRVLEAFAFLAL